MESQKVVVKGGFCIMDYSSNQCQPHEFIELLFGSVPTGFIEVAYIAPEGVTLYPRTLIQWAELPLHEIDPALPAIHAQNQRGYSCYFAPAVRSHAYEPQQAINKHGKPYTYYPRGKAKDASFVTALWLDQDKENADLQRLLNSPIMPSIILTSGGGFHAYWLLERPLAITDDNRAMIVQTLKGLAFYHGGDSKVADLARVMRLPGTINTKPERGGALCQVIDIIPGRYYYTDLELTYARYAAPALPTPRREVHLSADKHIPAWVEQYLSGGEREGNRNARLYSAARRLMDNGFSQSEVESLLIPRALSDGLAEREIQQTVNSAVRAPRGAADMPHHMQIRMGTSDKRLGS